MALLMLNTVKTTRLLNVFYTENYNKTWNVKWYPSTTVRTEFQHHSGNRWWLLPRLTVKQASRQMQTCGNRLWTSISFPSAAPSQGCQQESTQLPQDILLHCQQKRETFLCVVCCWTPDWARETTQETINIQCSLWSTLTSRCQKDRKDRKLQTNRPSDPDKWMENCNKISSHKEDTLAKM